MAGKKSGGGRGRENVPVPTKRELSDASKQLRGGHSSAGRVMMEKSVATKKPKGR